MVDYQKIEDVCQNIFAGGTPNTKREDYYDGNIPWIRSGEVDFNVITEAERNISELGYKNSSAKLIRKGSVVMAMTGATVAKSAIVEFETSANQSVCALETNEDIITYRFLYYLLSNNYFTIKSSAQGALTSLNLSMIKQIVIPVPSLKIQQEIVRILDSFTQLQSNLETELVARQKQYEFYRNKLFIFDKDDVNVEWKLLKDVTVISRGKRVVRKELLDFGIIPVYQNSLRPLGYSKESNYPANTPFVISAGAAGDVGYSDTEYWGADDCFSILSNDDLLPRFIFHWLKIKESYLQSRIRGGAIKRLSRDVVDSLSIPIIKLNRQQEIVSILDTFESLITNLKKEIEARKKQYEYYREHLLTFE